MSHRRRLPRMLLCIGLLTLAATLLSAQGLAPPSGGGGGGDERIRRLEQENRDLRAQVDALRKELAELRAAVAPNTLPAAAPSDPGPVLAAIRQPSPPTASAPVATQPQPLTYASLLDMLRDLPADARPSATLGWRRTDKSGDSVFDAARSYLRRAPVGNLLDTRLRIAAASVHRTPQVNGRNVGGKPDWYLSLRFEPVQHKYMGVVFQQSVTGPGVDDSITIYGDEVFARKADKVEAGQSLRVTGTIVEVALYPDNETHSAAVVHLSEYTLPALIP